MSSWSSVDVVLAAFDAVERRDEIRLAELCDPGVEFHWPPSLPYGGTVRGVGGADRDRDRGWAQWWTQVQPTGAQRRMHPRVVAATEQEVVVLWRQLGLAQGGERFDGEVLGLYQVSNGKLARAQMFYFDPVAASAFLASARGAGTAASSRPEEGS